MSRQSINDVEFAVTEHLKNSIPTNRDFIKLMGTQAAVILGELVSKQNLYSQTDPPSTNNNDYFYYTVGTMEKNTGYGAKVQRRELNKLKDAGFIDMYHNNGGKRRIRVNTAAVINILSQLRTGASWEPVIPSDDELNQVPNGLGTDAQKDSEPMPNGTGSNYTLTTDNYNAGGKGKKVNPTTEASEHYRKRFHDKHNQWPGKGIGSDRKDSNIILKPLVTEYGTDSVKKAVDNWLNDEWVHREKPSLRHLSKNILKYMNNKKDESSGLRNWTGASDEELYGIPAHRYFGMDCPNCNKSTYEDEKMCGNCGQAVN